MTGHLIEDGGRDGTILRGYTVEDGARLWSEVWPALQPDPLSTIAQGRADSA